MESKLERGLLIASNNAHKVEEMTAILAHLGQKILTPDELGCKMEVEENAPDYKGNALLKAQAHAKATGYLCIADDTGLEVDYLKGAPGIYSARWGGVEGAGRYEANNKKLLEELVQVEMEKRQARFVCTIVLADAEKLLFSVEGICQGSILTKERGENGFGYDPLFEVKGYGKTFAELDSELKNKISHRGLALAAFHNAFKNYFSILY